MYRMLRVTGFWPRRLLPVLVVVALMAGCGGEAPLPTSPDRADTAWDVTGPADRLTKPPTEDLASLRSETDTDTYWPGFGCYLFVGFKSYGSETDVTVKDAWFSAYGGTLQPEEQLDITMTVTSGATLDDVKIEFDPSGLVFDPPARLGIRLGGPVTEEEVRLAQHIYGDDPDNIELIETETYANGQALLTIYIDIPGFSEYSVGGDDEAEDDECWDGIDPP